MVKGPDGAIFVLERNRPVIRRVTDTQVTSIELTLDSEATDEISPVRLWLRGRPRVSF